jgi:cyanophycinase
MARHGYLMPIGGAEDKVAERAVLRRFIALAGGAAARVVIIPSASEIPDEVGPLYQNLFTAIGVAQADILDIREVPHANDPTLTQVLDTANGIFMTGGDQMRLAALLGNTLAGRKMQARLEAGAIVAGTSAGASAMSLTMIASGQSGTAPSVSLVEIAPGLGLIDGVVIDQHFRQRQRIGRLLTAVLLYQGLLGVGIDEDTALLIGPDNQCEVVGSGSVTIVDGAPLEYTDINQVEPNGLAAALGAKLHVLTQGYRYHLATRRADTRLI